MLYPKATVSRMVSSVNGTWDFKLLYDTEKGADKEELLASSRLQDSRPMAVPSAYNELYEGKEFRDHVGKMVYQRTVVVANPMLQERLVLRFSSVTHEAWCYWNGKQIAYHKGGFLPFEVEVTPHAVLGENLLTVVVSNIVDNTTLPAGRLETIPLPDGKELTVNYPNFDFFNYSGIMRPVVLYTTPNTYIQDIAIAAEGDGRLTYTVKTNQATTGTVKVLDGNDQVVFESTELSGSGQVENITPWSPNTPALYQMEVTLATGDQYTESFGFRTVEVADNRIMLNGTPIYLTGFGKHEDFPVLGRGFHQAINIKDISLMKAMGANSLRTSHYPYSEEMMRLCDREGILVIDEVAAVGLHTGFTATGLLGGTPEGTWAYLQTQEQHEQAIEELVARDKNHPCVILWSIANEPASEEEGAKEYFAPLKELCKEKDPQKRPVTIVTYGGSTPESCKVAELCDVLVINRYFGWYEVAGNLAAAEALLEDELKRWRKRLPNTPIILGEYGADAVAGIHDSNATMFSEEFQVEFLKTYSKVFDRLPFVAGEHVWNFADFATAENDRRVRGNKKGVFTRERDPKMAAHYLKERWTTLEK